jgi:hypothetical protein
VCVEATKVSTSPNTATRIDRETGCEPACMFLEKVDSEELGIEGGRGYGGLLRRGDMKGGRVTVALPARIPLKNELRS